MRVTRPWAALVVATAVLLICAAPTAATGAGPAGRPDQDHRATRQAIEAMIASGVPGVIAVAEEGRATWTGTAGTGDLRTGAPRHADQHYRAGSITKTFIATVLLQLQAEGRLSLDDTVDRWLPGVVRENGHDGRDITLRQLLNHTSGIFSYTEDPDFQRTVFGTGFLRHRYDTWTPQGIVGLAMSHRPYFRPGAGWHYSDTNYILAGMVIEKATGRSHAHEIERRILRPLRMDSTTLPGSETRTPRPSGRGYSLLNGTIGGPGTPGGAAYDVTELDPSIAGAAGEIISTAGDLNRFLRALFTGRLLAPGPMREMTTTVPIPGTNLAYGLGIARHTSSCGDLWGHNGGIHGSLSYSLTTADGGHTFSLNVNGDWGVSFDPVVEAEFCGR